jgi:hypothetical protein
MDLHGAVPAGEKLEFPAEPTKPADKPRRKGCEISKVTVSARRGKDVAIQQVFTGIKVPKGVDANKFAYKIPTYSKTQQKELDTSLKKALQNPELLELAKSAKEICIRTLKDGSCGLWIIGQDGKEHVKKMKDLSPEFLEVGKQRALLESSLPKLAKFAEGVKAKRAQEPTSTSSGPVKRGEYVPKYVLHERWSRMYNRIDQAISQGLDEKEGEKLKFWALRYLSYVANYSEEEAEAHQLATSPVQGQLGGYHRDYVDRQIMEALDKSLYRFLSEGSVVSVSDSSGLTDALKTQTTVCQLAVDDSDEKIREKLQSARVKLNENIVLKIEKGISQLLASTRDEKFRKPLNAALEELKMAIDSGKDPLFLTVDDLLVVDDIDEEVVRERLKERIETAIDLAKQDPLCVIVQLPEITRDGMDPDKKYLFDEFAKKVGAMSDVRCLFLGSGKIEDHHFLWNFYDKEDDEIRADSVGKIKKYCNHLGYTPTLQQTMRLLAKEGRFDLVKGLAISETEQRLGSLFVRSFDELVQSKTFERFQKFSENPPSREAGIISKNLSAAIEGLKEYKLDKTFDEKGLTPFLHESYARMLNLMEVIMAQDYHKGTLSTPALSDLSGLILEDIFLCIELTADPTKADKRLEEVLLEKAHSDAALKPSACAFVNTGMRAATFLRDACFAQKGESVETGKLNVVSFHDCYFELAQTFKHDNPITIRPDGYDYDKPLKDALDKVKEQNKIDVVFVDLHGSIDVLSPFIASHDVAKVIDRMLDSGKAQKPLTIAIDITIGKINDKEIAAIINKYQDKINDGILNIVCYRSVQKLDQLGSDKLSGGYLLVYSKDPSDFLEKFTKAASERGEIDPINKQGLAHLYKYCASGLDEYRSAMFENAKCLYEGINAAYKHPDAKASGHDFYVKESRDDQSYCILVQCKDKELFKQFLEVLKSRGFPIVKRGSFGFQHMTYSDFGGGNIRITIGVEDREKYEKLATYFNEFMEFYNVTRPALPETINKYIQELAARYNVDQSKVLAEGLEEVLALRALIDDEGKFRDPQAFDKYMQNVMKPALEELFEALSSSASLLPRSPGAIALSQLTELGINHDTLLTRQLFFTYFQKRNDVQERCEKIREALKAEQQVLEKLYSVKASEIFDKALEDAIILLVLGYGQEEGYVSDYETEIKPALEALFEALFEDLLPQAASKKLSQEAEAIKSQGISAGAKISETTFRSCLQILKDVKQDKQKQLKEEIEQTLKEDLEALVKGTSLKASDVLESGLEEMLVLLVLDDRSQDSRPVPPRNAEEARYYYKNVIKPALKIFFTAELDPSSPDAIALHEKGISKGQRLQSEMFGSYLPTLSKPSSFDVNDTMTACVRELEERYKVDISKILSYPGELDEGSRYLWSCGARDMNTEDLERFYHVDFKPALEELFKAFSPTTDSSKPISLGANALKKLNISLGKTLDKQDLRDYIKTRKEVQRRQEIAKRLGL